MIKGINLPVGASVGEALRLVSLRGLVDLCVCVCVYMYVRVCVCVYIYVCVCGGGYIYIKL
jgi:hypothetical protein